MDRAELEKRLALLQQDYRRVTVDRNAAASELTRLNELLQQLQGRIMELQFLLQQEEGGEEDGNG